MAHHPLLRLMYLNYEYPPIGGGGGATCKALAERVALLGHRVYVLTGGIRDHLGIEKPGVNLTIERINTLRRRVESCSKFEMIRYLIPASYLLLKRAREVEFDLIHVFFGFPTGGTLWLGRFILPQPYIISLLGGDVPGFLPRETGMYHRLLMPLTRALWRNAAAVVPDSMSLGMLAGNTLDREFPVITNGVDLTTFHSEGRKDEGDTLRLLFAGRLVPQKGLDVLLKALGRVGTRLPPWKLTILGDGPHAGTYKALSRDLGVDSNITWEGWVPFSELPRMYRNHDILVLPSRYEGMASVVLQAMACGCPVISSRVFGAEELISEGENGFLFEVEDDRQLGEKIALACTAGTLKAMQRRSTRKAALYGWDRVTDEYIRLYYHSLGIEP